MSIDIGIKEVCKSELLESPRGPANERHWIVKDENDLMNLCRWAHKQNYYFCTLVATDERLREDRTFKLYYVLSAPEDDELAILEHPLPDPNHPIFSSVREIYPSVLPFEKAIYDMFGIAPRSNNIESANGFLLHKRVYPADPALHPLRRTRPLTQVCKDIREWDKTRAGQPSATESLHLSEGMFIVPVGPIHAGVIEPGYFPFHVAGEIIEELPLQLGWKHRGIEKMFETHYTLEQGWALAEKISGDTSFAHSLAYCQAIENIAGVTPPRSALYWRSLFLELERIYNHISDVGLLALGIAYDRIASEISVLRETMVQLNQHLCGNRFLRGLNRPGGVVLSSSFDLEKAQAIVEAVSEEFLKQGKHLLEKAECRDRMLATGVLTRDEGRNAVGLVARAVGWTEYDFRLRHPCGAYKDSSVQNILRDTIAPDVEQGSQRKAPIFQDDLAGDVLGRLAIRVAEVETSAQLVQYLIDQLQSFDSKESVLFPITEALHDAPSMEIGLGYVEGWRGVVFYFVVKGAENTIFRCHICDPSLINWHLFPQAVVRKPKSDKPDEYWENILADFPLINKSFNLSYAGHDL